jgi:hypothetical protein
VWISTRTRQVLSPVKARGVRPLVIPSLHVARKVAVDAVKAEADRFAANVLPIGRTDPQGDCGRTQRAGHRDNTRWTVVRAVGRERSSARLGQHGVPHVPVISAGITR